MALSGRLCRDRGGLEDPKQSHEVSDTNVDGALHTADVYYAEKQSVRALKKSAKAARAQELKDAFLQHA